MECYVHPTSLIQRERQQFTTSCIWHKKKKKLKSTSSQIAWVPHNFWVSGCTDKQKCLLKVLAWYFKCFWELITVFYNVCKVYDECNYKWTDWNSDVTVVMAEQKCMYFRFDYFVGDSTNLYFGLHIPLKQFLVLNTVLTVKLRICSTGDFVLVSLRPQFKPCYCVFKSQAIKKNSKFSKRI